jgi:hypothetical protein
MFALYEGRVARESDLVCYWFEKARAQIEAGRAKRAGLLATQAIRGGANRKVLERIKETGDIFYAQADRKWILEGAAVQVSMVGFDDGSEVNRKLNTDSDDDPVHAILRAVPVPDINSNLTFEADVTTARRLKENAGICFQGPVIVGPFDLAPAEARKVLAGHNPHGQPNSLVVFPYVNAADLTGRTRGWSIVDFGQRSVEESALFEKPFEYVERRVKPLRDQNRDAQRKRFWWRHGRAGTELRTALAGKNRQIATPRVSKHRLFVWLDAATVVSDAVVVFARSDDYFFGVLHSRAHELWARATGTQLREAESGFRYTPTTCFETFPFPRAAQAQQRAIWLAAANLNELREKWLSPEGMIGAKELAKLTLTNLYNERPTWLVNAHRTLDGAVFPAYGWREAPDDLPDAEIVVRLLALNLAREPA